MNKGDRMPLAIDVANAQLTGRLTLFPVVSSGPAAPEYLCGPDAESLGVLGIREVRGGARVSELVIENRGTKPVLLIEGETLVGAKQNRTLNVSVLCAPGATKVPVSCVEAGRWGASRPGTRSARHAPSRLRARKSASVVEAMTQGRGRQSDQHQVWSDVEGYARRTGARSATQALEDAYSAAECEPGRRSENVSVGDSQVGVITAIGGRVVSLDVFDKPSSFASYWGGLVAGYELEALRQPEVAASLADAKAFATAVASAATQSDPATGLGRELRLESRDVVGLGLEWEGGIVHLAAFSKRSEHTGRPIRRRRPV
jgi:hypothetical protein